MAWAWPQVLWYYNQSPNSLLNQRVLTQKPEKIKVKQMDCWSLSPLPFPSPHMEVEYQLWMGHLLLCSDQWTLPDRYNEWEMSGQL